MVSCIVQVYPPGSISLPRELRDGIAVFFALLVLTWIWTLSGLPNSAQPLELADFFWEAIYAGWSRAVFAMCFADTDPPAPLNARTFPTGDTSKLIWASPEIPLQVARRPRA